MAMTDTAIASRPARFPLRNLARRAASLALVGLALALLGGCEQDEILDLAIAPGGGQVAYVRADAGLILIDMTTSQSRTLEMRGFRPGGLAWSPDGAWLVGVARNNPAPHWDLVLINTDTGTTRSLASHSARESEPVFSSDGARIYFASTRSGSSDIYVCDLRDDTVFPFIAAPFDQVRPRPEPRGRRVAYLSYERGAAAIHVTDGVTTRSEALPIATGGAAGHIVDFNWIPGAFNQMNVLFQTATEARMMRYDLDRQTLTPLGAVDLPEHPIPARFLIAAGRGATVASIQRHVAWGSVRPLGRGARLNPALPARYTRIALDAPSNTFAAVLDRRFLTIGNIQTGQGRVWLKDAEQARDWAEFLMAEGHAVQALEQMVALPDRIDPGSDFNQTVLRLAQYQREAGQTDAAWASVMRVINQRHGHAEEPRELVHAARHLGEIALFDRRDPDLARQWFAKGAEALPEPGETLCNAQTLLAQLSPEAIALYIDAVALWRQGAWRRATDRFERLLALATPPQALLDEVASTFFAASPEEAFLKTLRFERDGYDPRADQPWRPYQVRLAEAHIAAAPGRSAQVRLWLAAALVALERDDDARQHIISLVQDAPTTEVLAPIRDMYLQYATDTGLDWRRGAVGPLERQDRAFLKQAVERVLLASRVKAEVVLALSRWDAATGGYNALAPELAEWREGLNRGHSPTMAREQRFVWGKLNAQADAAKNSDWRLLSMIATGMTGETYLDQGDWDLAIQQLAQALDWPDEHGGADLGSWRDAYRPYVEERVALLDAASASTGTLRTLLAIERRAVAQNMENPLAANGPLWAEAEAELLDYLRTMDPQGPLAAVIHYLLADAALARNLPDEQALFHLKVALSRQPGPALGRLIARRLEALFQQMDDHYLAEMAQNTAETWNP